ncbi:hypothetical protein ACOSQ2_026936 [Xanthoceras sorbifolium]
MFGSPSTERSLLLSVWLFDCVVIIGCVESTLKIVSVPGCKRCGSACETTAHALLVCPKAAAVWEASSFGLLFVAAQVPSLFDFLCSFSQVLPHRDFELICIILWQLWFERNCSLHNGKLKAVADILSASILSWIPPPFSNLKLNSDVAIKKNSPFVGLGATIRDSSGKVVAAVSICFAGAVSVEVGEALALREGLLLAQDLGCSVEWVESDASNVINAVLETDLNLGLASHIF